MRLVVASLVKNEADKYWKSALDAWTQFADAVYVLDDNSTDKTAKIALGHKSGKVECVARYGEADAWGAESAARRELWDYVYGATEAGDVILWLDADMVPAGDPREFLQPDIDTYAFALYDLWGEDAHGRLLYRDDAFWCGHYRPRAWAVRRPRTFNAEWSGRGVHCGHLPVNWQAKEVAYLPPSHSLLHYAYYDERDRLLKAAKYLDVRGELLPSEASHALSILDAAPALKPLLKEPRWRLKRAK